MRLLIGERTGWVDLRDRHEYHDLFRSDRGPHQPDSLGVRSDERLGFISYSEKQRLAAEHLQPDAHQG